MRMVILALMLVVSHVALISHVTAHFAPNLEQCELCVSQAQLLAAIPVSECDLAIDPEGASLQSGFRDCTTHECLPRAYHQRAPPLTSA